MSRAILFAAVSLDGFVADEHDQVGPLFDWYDNGDVGGQALREGLIDAVVLNLVPAVLGTGRPFFGTGGLAEPVLFDDPRIVQGKRVTHLVYERLR